MKFSKLTLFQMMRSSETDPEVDQLVVPTCYVAALKAKKQPYLVMGAGAAKDVNEHLLTSSGSSVAREAWKSIGLTKSDYGFIRVGDGTLKVGFTESTCVWTLWLFQTKRHWKLPAIPEVIGISSRALAVVAEKFPDKRFHLPAPGIGNGKLDPRQLPEAFWRLPSNVIVHDLKDRLFTVRHLRARLAGLQRVYSDTEALLAEPIYDSEDHASYTCKLVETGAEIERLRSNLTLA